MPAGYQVKEQNVLHYITLQVGKKYEKLFKKRR